MNKEHFLAALDQDIYRSARIDGQSRKVFLRGVANKEVLEWFQNTIM